jgi:proteasome lid subunit RPN8/RPN11
MSSHEPAVSLIPGPPDAGGLRGADWPPRPFPPANGTRPAGFAAVFDRSVLRAVHLHGRESPDVEVCGVLLGVLGVDDHGPFVHVQDTIRGEHAGNQAGQVTFTAATWDHIQRAMDGRGPEERIVGWYHTHPDFGIFLSNMDVFIQRHFFDLPWQLALVYDPIRQKEGVFVWRSGELVEEAVLVHENIPPSDLPKVVLKGPPRPLAPEALDRAAEFSQRLAALETRLSWLGAGIAFAVLLGVAWPVVLVVLLTDRQEGAVAKQVPDTVPAVPGPVENKGRQGGDPRPSPSDRSAKRYEPPEPVVPPAELIPKPRRTPDRDAPASPKEEKAKVDPAQGPSPTAPPVPVERGGGDKPKGDRPAPTPPISPPR